MNRYQHQGQPSDGRIGGRSWVTDAERLLNAQRSDIVGWGYRANGTPSVESSVLSCLALMSLGGSRNDPAIYEVSEWCARIQTRAGAVPNLEGLAAGFWATPYALLLWSLLRTEQQARRKAVDWLLRLEGATLAPTELFGHDPTIVGWPWVGSTHSWLEPTALTMISLVSAGEGSHTRVRDGVRLIQNRAIPSGGWNYGNTRVLGTELRPQPDQTGIALAALAISSRADSRSLAVSERAIAYLRRELRETRALRSLSWGLIGMEMWDSRPAMADDWLEEASSYCHSVDCNPPEFALGVLARSGSARRVLGVHESV